MACYKAAYTNDNTTYTYILRNGNICHKIQKKNWIYVLKFSLKWYLIFIIYKRHTPINVSNGRRKNYIIHFEFEFT